MREDGYTDIVALENKTVVTDHIRGAVQNKWIPILKKYDVDFIPLTDVEWVDYIPINKMLAMNKIFPDGFKIPKPFIGANILHLPTQKTHGHTIMTGAMKNAFGGLLCESRHHAHKYIHEVLVDLLTIQKEIHRWDGLWGRCRSQDHDPENKNFSLSECRPGSNRCCYC